MMAYPKLREEMKERNIRRKDMAQALHLSAKGLYNKLHGLSEFTEKEIRIIQETFFPDLPTDCLFFQINDVEAEVPTEESVFPVENTEPETVESGVPDENPEVRPETEAVICGTKSVIPVNEPNILRRKWRIAVSKSEYGHWHFGCAFCSQRYIEGREIYLLFNLFRYDLAVGLLFPDI